MTNVAKTPAGGTEFDAPRKGAEPERSLKLIDGMISRISERIADGTAAEEFSWDPDFIRSQLGWLARTTRYFSPEIHGLENIPTDGSALVVGNHSCLYYIPDAWIAVLALLAQRGLESPLHPLGYDLLFAVPGLRDYLRRSGVLPARGEDAARALVAGELVLVYPGGDWESARPWTHRNRIDFHGRRGFIRLALRTGAPIVPVVSHGAHHAIVILTRGEKIAAALGLRRLRVGVAPILLGPPFLFNPLFVPLPPMPAAVTVAFLPPIRWKGLSAKAADDPETVDACCQEVVGTMQAGLDRLVADRPFPVLRGVYRHLTGRSGADPAYRELREVARRSSTGVRP